MLSSTETPWKLRKPSGTRLFKRITALAKENVTAIIKIIKSLVQIINEVFKPCFNIFKNSACSIFAIPSDA